MDVFHMGRSVGRDQDLIAVEDPLQIRLGDRDVAVTMRTPGNDDELAAGFLFTEGILRAREDIAKITYGHKSVTITLTRAEDPDHTARHRQLKSSRGLCGETLVDLLLAAGCTAPPYDQPTVDASVILGLPETMDNTRPIFDRTDGLQAAALFDVQGNLQLVREDVESHNSVDKLVGRSLLDGRVPLNDSVLLVSECVTFALVQKALMAGIPVVAALGALRRWRSKPHSDLA